MNRRCLAMPTWIWEVQFSFLPTKTGQENCVCIQVQLLSAMVAEPSEELVHFYSKIRKLQVKVSSHSSENYRKDIYMQIHDNQGCYISLLNSISK